MVFMCFRIFVSQVFVGSLPGTPENDRSRGISGQLGRLGPKASRNGVTCITSEGSKLKQPKDSAKPP